MSICNLMPILGIYPITLTTRMWHKVNFLKQCMLYSHIQLLVYMYKYMRKHNQLIMNTSITNEYTSL